MSILVSSVIPAVISATAIVGSYAFYRYQQRTNRKVLFAAKTHDDGIYSMLLRDALCREQIEIQFDAVTVDRHSEDDSSKTVFYFHCKTVVVLKLVAQDELTHSVYSMMMRFDIADTGLAKKNR